MEWQVNGTERYEKRVCWHNIWGETELAPREKIIDLSGTKAVNFFYIPSRARNLQTHLWPASLVVPPSALRLLLNAKCSPMRSLVYQGEEELMVNAAAFSSSWAYDCKTEIQNDQALTFTWTWFVSVSSFFYLEKDIAALPSALTQLPK